MKFMVKAWKEIDVAAIRIQVPVRYGEEDIPNDFPGRTGKVWTVWVDFDNGRIQNWPQGRTGDFSMKVCDEGVYTLYDRDGEQVATIDHDYVPNQVVPGEYGDYITMKIDASGTITNWPKHPEITAFFKQEE